MHRKTWMGYALTVALMAALTLVGCSDDKKTVGSTNGLSAEAQFDQIDDFIDLDFDGDDNGFLGLDALALGTGSINGVFLDGIAADDFDNFFIPGLGKQFPDGVRAATVSFQFVNGSWEISIDSILTSQGLTLDVDVDATVRFETADGSPQIAPDESTTKYTEQTTVDLGMVATTPDASFDIDYVFGSGVTITGLETNDATINSTTSGSLTADFVGTAGNFHMGLNVSGAASNVLVTDFEEDGCPESGSMNVTVGLDLSGAANGQTYSANGTWNVGVQVVQGGDANVVVSSGDFSKSSTTNLCDDE